MTQKLYYSANGTKVEGARLSTNRKTDGVFYISLPCFGCENSTCRHDAPCAVGCYALNDKRKSVLQFREFNFKKWLNDPAAYFGSIVDYCKLVCFFRWHEAGDIINYNYLCDMVEVAKQTPNCKHVCFTKKFELVNRYISENGSLPGNLIMILSAWMDWKPENPYSLPTTDVLPVGEAVPAGGLKCGGNCKDCACVGVGCWQLKKGDTLYFKAHGTKANQIQRG